MKAKVALSLNPMKAPASTGMLAKVGRRLNLPVIGLLVFILGAVAGAAITEARHRSLEAKAIAQEQQSAAEEDALRLNP